MPQPSSPALLGKKKKILVVGVTGSGKSTCALRLSEILQIPHIELDDLHWDANWTPSPHFQERVAKMLQQRDDECWIVDGNYTKALPILWDHADTVVWLDYPFWTVFWRLLRRCIYRWWYQIPLWSSGNIDNIWTHLTSPSDSLFVWLWKRHPVLRERYNDLKTSDTTTGRVWRRFRSPSDTEQWLAELKQQQKLD